MLPFFLCSHCVLCYLMAFLVYVYISSCKVFWICYYYILFLPFSNRKVFTLINLSYYSCDPFFKSPKNWFDTQRNVKILFPILPPFVYMHSPHDYRRKFQGVKGTYAFSFGSFIPVEEFTLLSVLAAINHK